MRDILVLNEAALRRCVALDDEVVDVIESAFATLAGGAVVMPPILSMAIEDANGEVDVKTAYLPGFDGFAIKVSPGFFDNPKIGLRSLNGLVILFSARTGLVDALMLDNGYLTDIRTAAAGAVAARHLAPAEVDTVTVFGSGAQARLQVEAARLVRPFRRVHVCARDPDRAAACARDIGAKLGVEAGVAGDAADAVAQSQLVITTTASRTPLLEADWLHPGLHVTAMGSDQVGKNEIDPRVLRDVDLYACDRLSQVEVLGELASARAAGYLGDIEPVELGDIVSGRHPGRANPRQVTLCDLTGTGAQDTAIATVALRLARAAGLGEVTRA